MDGVTFLNEFIHRGSIIQPWLTIGICLCIGGLFGLVGFWTTTILSKKFWSAILALICVIAMFVGIFITLFAPCEEITCYQVIVDDSVGFNEFNKHYKIIDQEGLIYTIEEREPG